MKYTCLNPIAACGLSLLPADYEKTENIAEADAVLVRSASMHDMEFSGNLKAIARAGAGVNNIPLDKCAEKGIVVFNTPGANANGVKELIVAALILGSRDLKGGMAWVDANKDDENIIKTMEKAKSKYAGREIQGKKLGVIGLGAIGVLVANAANRLGMEVLGCDPYLSVEHALDMSRDITLVKTREEIFKECDYITLHVPLLDDTREMINAETIGMMKDGVVLLNFARDLLVNEDALEDALKSGKIANYVTDFPTKRVANLDHVIAFPHLGATTAESEDNCAIMAAKEITDFLENGNIKNSVNYPACDAGVCETEGRITICHRNIKHMFSQFTKALSDSNINIENMTSKSRGEYAYSVLDTTEAISEETAQKIAGIDGVLKVRVVK